jgi:hypothetical protein
MVAALDDNDFNPGFSFDFGGGGKKQQAWEFAGG